MGAKIDPLLAKLIKLLNLKLLTGPVVARMNNPSTTSPGTKNTCLDVT